MTPIAVLLHHAGTNPDGIAFIDGDDWWTYKELAVQAERLARGLTGQGVLKGDRIVLHMPNRPELILAFFACFRIGAIAVPLNNGLKNAELKPLFERIRPVLYIGEANLYSQVDTIEPAILALNRRFITGTGSKDTRAQPWESLLNNVAASAPAVSDLHSPTVLFVTSATTGVPKLVIHTQATLAATVDLWEHFGLDWHQTAMIAVPMVRFAGFANFLACICTGVPVILIERFDPDDMLDEIERHRCTWVPGTGPVFMAMLKCQQLRPRNVSSLRICVTTGDICPPQLQRRFSAVFGIPLRSSWGATEVMGSLTYGLEPGLVSRIVNGAQVRIVDDAGVPVPPGEVGELIIRGPNVSIGYWASPGMVECAPNDGWFRTGDLMRQDGKGQLWFVSRKGTYRPGGSPV